MYSVKFRLLLGIRQQYLLKIFPQAFSQIPAWKQDAPFVKFRLLLGIRQQYLLKIFPQAFSQIPAWKQDAPFACHVLSCVVKTAFQLLCRKDRFSAPFVKFRLLLGFRQQYLLKIFPQAFSQIPAWKQDGPFVKFRLLFGHFYHTLDIFTTPPCSRCVVKPELANRGVHARCRQHCVTPSSEWKYNNI